MPYATDITDNEVNYFFNVKIGILEVIMVKLREESINRREDLVDFNADNMRSVDEALRKPGGLVPSGCGTRTSPTLVSASRVCIWVKALVCLEA